MPDYAQSLTNNQDLLGLRHSEQSRNTFVLLQVPRLAHWKVTDTSLQRCDCNMSNE